MALDKWKRQEGETGPAYAAFCGYLELGPARSIAKLCNSLGKTSGYTRYLEEWSSKYEWVARALVYDDEMHDKRREQASELKEHMRHRVIANADQWLDNLMAIARGEKGANHSAQVSAAKALMDFAGYSAPTKVELTSPGGSTTITVEIGGGE